METIYGHIYKMQEKGKIIQEKGRYQDHAINDHRKLGEAIKLKNVKQ